MASSDIGVDLYATAASGGNGDGITTEARAPKPTIGRSGMMADTRMIRYDRFEARARPPIKWEVTKDSQMSAIEAGDTLEKLYALFGLVGQTASVLESFLEALCFAHTLNSASTLQPGRAKFSIGANINYLDFGRVVEYLGNDLRRFFRALANETRNVNQRVLAAANDPDDIVAMEKAQWLRAAAAKRGMSRHPDLAHDTADACWHLTDAEHAAILASKAGVFSTSPNMADRVRGFVGQSGTTEAGSMYVTPTARAHALAAQG